MPSAGIMASAVNISSGVCTDVLAEPFNSFANWSNQGATIVAGRNGTAAQGTTATNNPSYNIPSAGQSDVVTMGFAWRFTDAAPTSQRSILRLHSDFGALNHNRLLYTPSATTLSFTRATTVIGQNTAVTMTQNTWYYIEVQCKLHDTTGFVIVRIDGTEVINATGLDTKSAGTKTVYDQIELGPITSGCTHQYDDFYLSTGAGCSFQGDHAITSTKLIDEPFNNLAANAWTNTGGIPVAARNGAGLSVTGSTTNAYYSIVSGVQSDTLTVGFAWRYDDVGAGTQRDTIRFLGDAGATVHNGLLVMPSSGGTGRVAVYRATTSTILAQNLALGIFARSTWYYFEVQIKLHDTTGYVIVRLNGTQIINATGLDTKNAGTATVYDRVLLAPFVSGATGQYDDLYLYNAAATFEGDHAIGVAKILDEPFNDLARWTLSGVTGVVTGRNGNGAQIPGVGECAYPITSEQRSTLLTTGFAVQFASLSAVQTFLLFRITGGLDVALRVNTDGSLSAMRSTTTVLASSSAGVITAATWAYVEASVLHSNAGGTFTVRVNGTQVIAFTGDTNNAFADTDAYTSVALVGTVSQTVTFDDFYLRNDATFEGDHAIS